MIMLAQLQLQARRKSRKSDLCTMIDIMMTEIKIWSNSTLMLRVAQLVIFLTAKVKKLLGTISCKFMLCSWPEVLRNWICGRSSFKQFSMLHDMKEVDQEFQFLRAVLMLNYLWCYFTVCNLKPLYGRARQNSHCYDNAFLENCCK